MSWFGRKQDGFCDFCLQGRGPITHQGRGAIYQGCATQFATARRWGGERLRLPTVAWAQAMIAARLPASAVLDEGEIRTVIATVLTRLAEQEVERLALDAIGDFDGFTEEELIRFYRAMGLSKVDAEAEFARREAFEASLNPEPAKPTDPQPLPGRA